MENREISVEQQTTPEFPRDIEKLQDDVRHGFVQHFESVGYKRVDPEPLIPQSDESLIFTNATIVPLKKYIAERSIPPPGIIVEQPCLRFQNLRDIYDIEKPINYASYFRMLGTLSPASSYEQMRARITDYIKRRMGYKFEDIKILISSDDIKVLPGWDETGVIELDSRSGGFYDWKYGMEGIKGQGLTFSIKQEGYRFEDLGNVVAISDNEKVIGYEFGFGVETALARRYKLTSPLQAARISEVVRYENNPLQQKYQDTLVLACIFYRLGIRPGEGKRNYLAKKNIKGLLATMRQLGYSSDDIRRDIEGYEKIEFGTITNSGENIVEDLLKYVGLSEKNTSYFKDYLANQIRLQKQGMDRVEFTERMIKVAAIKYKISRYNAEAIIEKALGN